MSLITTGEQTQASQWHNSKVFAMLLGVEFKDTAIRGWETR